MYTQWAAACCREKRWTGCRCNMSVVAVKNWSKPQHLSWSASSMPASSGISCTLRPLQSDKKERHEIIQEGRTKKNEFPQLVTQHRWTQTVRVGSREVGGSSTRWVHLRCAGSQLLHPLASLWWSYTCKPNQWVSESFSQINSLTVTVLKELLKIIHFLYPICIYLHGWFIFARPSIWYEGKTPTCGVVKSHTNTPQVNTHSIGFLMGLA